MKLRYLITREKQLDLLTDYLREQPIFAYDTETNGKFDQFELQLVGISFGFDTFACYLPLTHNEGRQIDINVALEKLKPIFEDENIAKVAHNAKFDEKVLRRYDVNVAGIGFDTFIEAWLLSEDRSSKGLKALVSKHLGIQMETYEEVVSKAPKRRGVARDYNFARVDLKSALAYAADDAYFTFALHNHFKQELRRQKLWTPYIKIEAPFNRVLRNMEYTGVHIDKEAIDYADKRLPQIFDQVEAEIYEEAGEVFNIGSGKQLGAILFERLGIGKNVPRTAKGDWSTNKKTLETYATKHKIVENVLRRKKINKTHSTFVTGTKEFISQDGKVHPSFNGCGTVTGRLSCSSPNLQQIEGDEVEEIKVRNFFVPSSGYTFVVADYSQIELRLMAHFSKDKEMTAAFMAADEDFHDAVARRVFEVPEGQEVSRRQRVVAKTLNFGVGYGRGPKGISEQLQISEDEASKFIQDWFDRFEGVREYKKHVISEARQKGFIRTLSGRKRRLLPAIRSDDWRLRGGAERQAFNTKIQGSAADLIKLAMIELEPKLNEFMARMVIQIHDELVIEVPRNYEPEFAVGIIKQTMENPLNGKNPLRLPLVTEPAVVEHWGDAK